MLTGDDAQRSESEASSTLADIVERERRRRLFDEADAAYARLQGKPVAWADYRAELRSMDGTLMDGLEDDPWVESSVDGDGTNLVRRTSRT